MDILSYLNEIINTRKEVGIPGLGTFYKKKSPGRYSADIHSFLPPSYHLEFTTELKEQTLLKDFISKKENVDSDNASFHIDQLAQKLREQLENGENVKLGDLGELSSGVNGIIFNPRHEPNIGFDFYGMPSMKEISSQNEPDNANLAEENIDVNRPATANIDEDPVYEEISEIHISEKVKPVINIETPERMHEETAEVPTVASPPEFQYDLQPVEVESSMPTYLKIIIVVSIIVIAIIVAYFIKPELFTKFTKGSTPIERSQTLIVPDSKQTDSIAFSDSTEQANRQAVIPVDSVQGSVPVQKPDTTISYEIIAASLLNKKEADNFLNEMARRGIPAKVANMPGRRIKISIGTFTDEETANAQLQLLKKTTKIPGIYIYTNRHTNNIK